ncbi:MAG: hypothetical protein QX199_10810 [Methylococcaceae bacterium]
MPCTKTKIIVFSKPIELLIKCKLGDADQFTGSITNWNADDVLDLVDIDFNNATMSYTADMDDSGILTVSDGEILPHHTHRPICQ